MALTLARLVPSLLLLLLLLLLLPPPLAPAGGICREVEERGATGRLVPTPMPGEMERAGTLGGGPGSAPGERRCELREGFMSVGVSAAASAAVLVPNSDQDMRGLGWRGK